mgnify:CR=1 FL=1
MIQAMKMTSQLGLHLVVAVTVSYALTGSLALGGAIALIEPVCNLVAGHFHEKAWARLGRRRGSGRGAQTAWAWPRLSGSRST